MFNIEEELKKLPGKPGVYVMRDKNDTIIYVGKAVSLKNIVRQYFRKTDKTEISLERKRHEEKIPCQKEEKVCPHRYPMIE